MTQIGGYWKCSDCGEEYHSSELHVCSVCEKCGAKVPSLESVFNSHICGELKLKNGFIFNFAYCQNCAWSHSTEEVPIYFFKPFALKEDLFEKIFKIHDTNGECSQRRVVISYTLCAFEE